MSDQVPEGYTLIKGQESTFVPLPPSDMVETDGVPLDSNWHRMTIALLCQALSEYWSPREDYFVGGNMFIYFDAEQVRTWSYRGPDFFVVRDVRCDGRRRYWATWEEGGRYPDLIMELLSPRTAEQDRTTTKHLYERTFRTPEYFLYDFETSFLEGWRLHTINGYEPIRPDSRGWLWSEVLQLWLGNWTGKYELMTDVYPRFYEANGSLVLTGGEAAEKRRIEAEQERMKWERQRIETEQERMEWQRQRIEAEQRCLAAEAEIAEVKARLAERNAQQPSSEPPKP